MDMATAAAGLKIVAVTNGNGVVKETSQSVNRSSENSHPTVLFILLNLNAVSPITYHSI